MNLNILKNKKLVTIYVLGIIFIIIGFGLIQNIKNDKNDSPIIIYYADNIAPAQYAVVTRFNELYKGKIEVRTIDLPFTKFSTNDKKELLARSLRGRSERIDVFAVDQVWIKRFSKWCEPIDKYLTDAEKNNLLERAKETCLIENKLYAIPYLFDISLLYFRQDILEKYYSNINIDSLITNPLQWKDFINYGLQKRDKNSNYYLFPAQNYEGLICSFVENILSQDENYFKNGDFNLNSPEAEKSLQLLVDLVQKYNLTPKFVTNYIENDNYNYFLKNEAPFIRGWTSFEMNYKLEFAGTDKENYLGKTFLPYMKGGKPAAVYGGWSLMISKFSKNKEAVLDFIKFAISEEAQQIFYEISKYLPINKNFYTEQKYLEQYPDLERMKSFIDIGVHRPSLNNYTRISDIISFYAKKAILGEISTKEALRLAELKIEENSLL